MNGYPVGTKCVVVNTSGATNSTWLNTIHLGDVVTVVGPLEADIGGKHGYYLHPVDRVICGIGCVLVPPQWMRPLDQDMTHDDLDVVAALKSPIPHVHSVADKA